MLVYTNYLSMKESIDVLLIHLVDGHYSLLFMYVCFNIPSVSLLS